MSRPVGGPFRLCVDKDAIVHQCDRLANRIVGFLDVLVKCPLLDVHYKKDLRLFPPIIRFLSGLKREGRLLEVSDAPCRLSSGFCEAFNNEDDLYLIHVSGGLGCHILISDDRGVIESRARASCAETYETFQPALKLLYAMEY